MEYEIEDIEQAIQKIEDSLCLPEVYNDFKKTQELSKERMLLDANLSKQYNELEKLDKELQDLDNI